MCVCGSVGVVCVRGTHKEMTLYLRLLYMLPLRYTTSVWRNTRTHYVLTKKGRGFEYRYTHMYALRNLYITAGSLLYARSQLMSSFDFFDPECCGGGGGGENISFWNTCVRYIICVCIYAARTHTATVHFRATFSKTYISRP